MQKLEKNLFRITWPIFIELLFFVLLGTVDTIMLSRYSDLAIGSVGISNQLLFFFGVILNVVGLGIGVVVTQYLGAKQEEDAKDALVTGVLANTILGLILSVILLVAGRQLLVLINTDAILFEDSLTYLRIVGISILFMGLRVSLSTGFRSFSKPRVVMVIMIIGNIVNIILNAILIYGLFGFPSLGVEGAAIGTLVSRIVIAILLIVMTYKSLGVRLHYFRLHINHLKKILYIGLPSALENILWSFSQVIIVYFLNKTSVESVVARNYIYTILSFIYVFSFSVCQGNTIIVGYYLGEKNYQEAYKRTFRSLYIAFAFVFVSTGLVNILDDQIIGLFTKNDEIISLAKSVLQIAIFLELGRAMNMVMIYALRAAGDTIFPVVVGAITMYGLAVFLAYLFVFKLDMGIVGVFLAAMIDEVFRGLIMVWRWRQRAWMELRVIPV